MQCYWRHSTPLTSSTNANSRQLACPSAACPLSLLLCKHGHSHSLVVLAGQIALSLLLGCAFLLLVTAELVTLVHRFCPSKQQHVGAQSSALTSFIGFSQNWQRLSQDEEDDEEKGLIVCGTLLLCC